MNNTIMWLWSMILISLLLTILMNLLNQNYNTIVMLISLIFYSLIIACSMGYMNSMKIISYMIFLTMTGGVMILFSFFLSLISNIKPKKTSFNLTILFFFSILLLMMILSLYTPIKYNFDLNKNYQNIMVYINKHNYYPLNLNKLFYYPTNFILIMLIIYLFISLILITKICSMTSKPLRKYN